MTTKLTQSIVNGLTGSVGETAQVYDAEVPGLRVVVGRRSASYKLVGRINDGTGRYVSISLGRTDELSLKTVRAKATELRLALRRGEDPRRPKRTSPSLEQAFERYLKARGDELRPSTRQWYRSQLHRALSSLRRLPLDRIDRERVRELHERLTRTRGAYAANGAMRVLKLVYNDAARSIDLPPNPVTRAVRMNAERSRDWAIGAGELPELWRRLDAMDDPVRRACWMTMLLTGLRSHDARSMRIEHLDDDGVLTVPFPKGGERRAFRLPLPRLLLDEIADLAHHTKPLESPFVFPSPASRSGHVEEMRRTSEFPYAPHQLRHTYRTAALEAGVDFQTVTILMNHANPHVSFSYVTRAHLVGHLREAQERVCAFISSRRAPEGGRSP